MDVVNEHNEVMDRALKRECHARGLLHRGAAVIVFTDATMSEIILQERAQGITNPGQFCHFGGHVSTGEVVEAAARRELQEELFSGRGEVTFLLEPLFTFLKDDPHDREFITVFRTVVAGPFAPDPQEVARVHQRTLITLQKELVDNPERYTFASQRVFEEYFKRFRVLLPNEKLSSAGFSSQTPRIQ